MVKRYRPVVEKIVILYFVTRGALRTWLVTAMIRLSTPLRWKLCCVAATCHSSLAFFTMDEFPFDRLALLSFI